MVGSTEFYKQMAQRLGIVRKPVAVPVNAQYPHRRPWISISLRLMFILGTSTSRYRLLSPSLHFLLEPAGKQIR
jgi:hypothetical protein